MNNNDSLLIGIDVGTSSCKVTTFDILGKTVCSYRESYPLINFGDGRIEQNPDDYVRAVISAVRKSAKAVPDLKDRIAGIGLTGQWPTETVLDDDYVPVRPMITWADVRAVKEAKKISKSFSKAVLDEHLAAKSPVSASLSPSRMLWIKDNEPDNFKKSRYYVGAKDYVGLFLTGELYTDIWSARTLADVNGHYYEEYLNALGYTSSMMPKTADWCSSRGKLSEKVAKELCLKAGIPVSIGCDDGFATLLGSGIQSAPYTAFDSSGTSEIIGISVKNPVNTDAVTLIPSEVTKGLPVTFGPTQSGGASLKWFAEDVLGTDIHSAEFLAEKTGKGSDGMIFLPYISGERSPIWNPNATGSFHYIKSTTKAGSFVRSVMEGVAFSIRHVLEVCSPDRKAEIIRISGGGAKSDLWAQIKSDVNGVPVELLKCQDASSLGAAITASICSGIYSDISEATKKMVHTDKIIYPDENSAETYDLLYEKYLEESKRASEN